MEIIMIYLAHMSCEEPITNNPEGFAQSIFTCVVEADNVDQAQNRLRNLIFELRKKQELFGRARAIYLDDLIEIRKVPTGGFLGRYESRIPGDELGSVSISLPGIDEADCRLYSTIPPAEQESGISAKLPAFITF